MRKLKDLVGRTQNILILIFEIPSFPNFSANDLKFSLTCGTAKAGHIYQINLDCLYPLIQILMNYRSCLKGNIIQLSSGSKYQHGNSLNKKENGSEIIHCTFLFIE